MAIKGKEYVFESIWEKNVQQKLTNMQITSCRYDGKYRETMEAVLSQVQNNIFYTKKTHYLRIYKIHYISQYRSPRYPYNRM